MAITDHIAGKWTLKERTGDFDGFLASQGVPPPIAFALKNLVSKSDEYKITKDGDATSLQRIELATTMFGSNTEHPAMVIGGPGVKDKNPAGAPCVTTVALDGDTLKLVEKELKADGTETGNSVTVVIAAAGAGCDFTITNQAGISFVEKMVRA